MSRKKLAVDEVRRTLENAYALSCKPNSDKFPKPQNGTVLDEDMSVRWNREEVRRLQDEYRKEAERLSFQKNQEIAKALKQVYKYISQETGLSEEKARKLWNFAYNNHHAYPDSLFRWLKEYMNLYNELK